MDASSIAVLISTAGATLVAILSQIQHSRCASIRGCCVECARSVPDDQDPVPDVPLQSSR